MDPNTLAIVTLALLGANELLTLAFVVAGTPMPNRPWPIRVVGFLAVIAIVALCITVL